MCEGDREGVLKDREGLRSSEAHGAPPRGNVRRRGADGGTHVRGFVRQKPRFSISRSAVPHPVEYRSSPWMPWVLMVGRVAPKSGVIKLASAPESKERVAGKTRRDWVGRGYTHG